MLLLNVCGALAHLGGIIVAQTVARKDFRLSTWTVQPKNLGNASDPEMTAELTFVGWVYPTTIITAFFALSFTFHVVISCFLAGPLIIGPGYLTNWYLKGLYYCVAPWVRYSHTTCCMSDTSSSCPY
jgi:hypothetical protein